MYALAVAREFIGDYVGAAELFDRMSNWLNPGIARMRDFCVI